MVSYEEAKKIAFNLKKNITDCAEYTDAYIFSSIDDEYTIGGSGPVVIIKKTGRAVNMIAYTDMLAEPGSRFVRDIFKYEGEK